MKIEPQKEPRLLKKYDDIQQKIYLVRGLQVMLDKDLALFYEEKPIKLREQVKRNIKRFPVDFMFRLTKEESETMVSQNAIPSMGHLGGSLPYVFTEQGVAALSAIINSERAIEVSIQIMRTFVSMRRFISTNAQIFKRIDVLEVKQIETDRKIDDVLNAIESKEVRPKQGIFYDGQIFDAYKFVADIVRSAQKSITIIDNYIDDTVLDLLSKRRKNIKVTLLTRMISKQLLLDVKKYSEQYPSIVIKEFSDSHDRFMIIDENTIYHFGASLKDLGKKWFAFSKMDIAAAEMLAKLKVFKA